MSEFDGCTQECIEKHRIPDPETKTRATGCTCGRRGPDAVIHQKQRYQDERVEALAKILEKPSNGVVAPDDFHQIRPA